MEFEVLEEGVLIKLLRENSREAWARDIEDIIKKSESKKDEALLDDFLKDLIFT